MRVTNESPPAIFALASSQAAAVSFQRSIMRASLSSATRARLSSESVSSASFQVEVGRLVAQALFLDVGNLARSRSAASELAAGRTRARRAACARIGPPAPSAS